MRASYSVSANQTQPYSIRKWAEGISTRLMYHFVTQTVCYCIFQTECEYSIAVYPEILFLQFINCIIREQYSIMYWDILSTAKIYSLKLPVFFLSVQRLTKLILSLHNRELCCIFVNWRGWHFVTGQGNYPRKQYRRLWGAIPFAREPIVIRGHSAFFSSADPNSAPAADTPLLSS